MKKTRTNSAVVSHWIFWNRARVPNPPDCADPGLHSDRRRDQVAKRPNTSRTAARAGVEGRHLPDGSAEWRQPRFRNFPRGAWRPAELGPFLGPNPSIQNHRGVKLEGRTPPPNYSTTSLINPWRYEKHPNRVGFERGHHGPDRSGRGPVLVGPLTRATCTQGRHLFSRSSSVAPPCL